MESKKLSLDLGLVQGIATYLAERPYKEVASALVAIQQEINKQYPAAPVEKVVDKK